MARIPNEKHYNAKRGMIIEKAREVFCHKGFLSVTMKDIVDACGISRGGLYLFFSSVEELFEAVIASRNISRFEIIKKQIQQNVDFFSLFDMYLNMQKDRIMHMENSIIRATYEYYSVHQCPSDIEFRNSQIACIKKTILNILNLGVSQGAIVNNDIAGIAESYMFIIEGMSVFGMFSNISEANIMAQIQLMKSMLTIKKKEE